MSFNTTFMTSRFVKIVVSTSIWISFLLPWAKLFERGYATGLGIAILNPLGMFALLPILLFAGDNFIIGFINKSLFNRRLRLICFIWSLIGIIVIGSWFFYSIYGNTASRINGIEIGYWVCWLGLAVSAIIEFTGHQTRGLNNRIE